MYQSLIRKAAFLGIAILFINAAANTFYWYTSIFGFDKGMHTLGGVFIVFLVAAFFLKSLIAKESWQLFITLVLAAFVIGLFWEFYEYIVQAFIKGVQLANISDSIGDLVFDVLGGCVGAYFVILMRKRYTVRNG